MTRGTNLGLTISVNGYFDGIGELYDMYMDDPHFGHKRGRRRVAEAREAGCRAELGTWGIFEFFQ